MLTTVLVACNKVDAPKETGEIKVSINAENNLTKVLFGDLVDGKRQVTWNETGEDLKLWEFADGVYTQSPTSSAFERVASDPTKASFDATLAEKEGTSFDYMAIYPAASSRTADKSGHPSCISYALSVTATDMQKPTATTPDKGWMVLTATSKGHSAQPAELDLTFEHQTAYGKMTFKNFPLADGEVLQSVNVTGPTGKYFTGRRWLDVATGEITPYSATAQKNTFTIDASGLTANSTSFDIWFSVLPVDLAQDEVLTVTAVTSQNTRIAEITLPRALNFKKGEVASFSVNWSNYLNTDKVLVFDFSGSTAQEGWPTNTWGEGYGQRMTCTYVLSETESYQFELIEPGFATGGKIYWNTSAKYFFFGKYRYLGLPLISGYVLKKVDCTVAKAVTSSAVAIMDHVYSPASAADPDSYAVAAQSWNVAAGTVKTYEINATSDSQQYYLYCKNPSGGTCFTKLVLTYAKL